MKINTKTLILFCIFFSLINFSYAQNKHIKYLSNMHSDARLSPPQKKGEYIVKSEDDKTFRRRIYRMGECEFNILVFDNNKSIAYNDNSRIIIKDSISNQIIRKVGDIDIFKKRNKSYRKYGYTYYYQQDSLYSFLKCGDWKKVNRRYIKKKYDFYDKSREVSAATLYAIQPDYEIPVYKMQLKITGEQKNIKGFLCEETILEVYEDKVYQIWFTKEIDYSWSFNNYFSLIPGTVIIAKKDDKTVLEFKEITDVDFSETIFGKEKIKEILENSFN
jgi:hypothetical protein